MSALGSVTPRLAPEPLRDLSAPGATYGHDVIWFAEHVLQLPLDPWQAWLVIHAGELLPGGRPRFRKLLIIVARQMGKTHLLKVLTLFWLFVEQHPMILGQSTTLTTAKESWIGAQEIAEQVPDLRAEFGTVRRDNNDPHWRVATGGKYRIAAANRKGGRGLTIDRLIVDEIREHQNWEAYSAALPAMNARPNAQAWFISNQGDERSVVLLALRKAGIANIEGDESTDEELGLFEWSAPSGADVLDVEALCMANPNIGHRGAGVGSLLADARRAKANGGEELTKFRTEIMCQYVPALDAAVDGTGWALGEQKESLAGARGRLVLVPELAPDQAHASITVAATMPGGKVRVEVLASWAGADAATKLRRALPEWVRKVRPRKVGYLAGGPVEAIVADFDRAKLGGVEIEAIKTELPAVCMGFAEKVAAGEILHSGQELLTKQTLGSAKLWRGAVWVFSRKGEGHCDTTYGAAAGAHLARTLPASAPLRIVTAPD